MVKIISTGFSICVTLCAFAQESSAQDWRAYISPGPLGEAHQQFSGTCDKCHLVFKGVPDEKCLSCHSAIDSLVTDGLGFHGRVQDKPCISCHVDHKGTDHSLTTPEAIQEFDHGQTQFPLEGSHQKLECSDCHNEPLEELQGSCAKCHEDPHARQLGNDCQSCHNSGAWEAYQLTPDQHTTRMDGGHQDNTCYDCHSRGQNLETKVACATCHDQAHGGTEEPCSGCHKVSGFKPAKFEHDLCPCSFPGKHKEADCLSCHEGFKFTDTPTLCSGCHEQERPHDPIGECSVCHSPLTWEKNKFNHNRQSKFKLENAHLEVDCYNCHPLSNSGEQVFGGTPDTCYECHKRQGIEQHGDFGNCQKCHTTKGFNPSTFNHDHTGFKLDGQHQTLDCQSCHEQKVDGYEKSTKPRVKPKRRPLRKRKSAAVHNYPDSDTSIYSPRLETLVSLLIPSQMPKILHQLADTRNCQHCHENPHPPATRSKKKLPACTTCHSPQAWEPPLFTLADHAKTQFPLNGAHKQTECQLCHVDHQLYDQPTTCASCHFDVHQGKFGKDCQSCHVEASFKPAPKFDHSNTGFDLVGVHNEVSCIKCHGGDGQTDLSQVTDEPECKTCHAPGHGLELGEDCTQCHILESDKTFAVADRTRFDHNTTPFPLERRHQLVACASCHPAPVNDEPHMAPTGRCSTCHLDPHKGNNSNDCAQCHAPDRWRLVRFDHDAAGWPLTGKHFITSCIDCHTNQRWFGLPTDCFDCHAIDAARGAQVQPNLHAFGRLECVQCHFNRWTWRMQ